MQVFPDYTTIKLSYEVNYSTETPKRKHTYNLINVNYNDYNQKVNILKFQRLNNQQEALYKPILNFLRNLFDERIDYIQRIISLQVQFYKTSIKYNQQGIKKLYNFYEIYLKDRVSYSLVIKTMPNTPSFYNSLSENLERFVMGTLYVTDLKIKYNQSSENYKETIKLRLDTYYTFIFKNKYLDNPFNLIEIFEKALEEKNTLVIYSLSEQKNLEKQKMIDYYGTRVYINLKSIEAVLKLLSLTESFAFQNPDYTKYSKPYSDYIISDGYIHEPLQKVDDLDNMSIDSISSRLSSLSFSSLGSVAE